MTLRRTPGAVLVACATAILLSAGQSVSATDGPEPVTAPQSDNAQRDLLATGRDLMTLGESRRAIDEYFDKVIQYYERTYKDSERVAYSSQNLQMSLLYAAIPRPDKKGSEVLDSTWGDAYLLKAYALMQLGELLKAREALQSALVVSPMSARYTSELANTYVAEKNFDRSIALYRQSADFANRTSSGAMRTEDLGRACRGEAHAMVEMGKRADARALYKKCLTLDPDDPISRGELEHIDGLEKRP